MGSQGGGHLALPALCAVLGRDEEERDDDDQHGQRRGDGCAVANLLRLEELAVRVVAGHDGRRAWPSARQRVDGAEHFQCRDRASQADHIDLGTDDTDGDKAETLEPVGTVKLGGLVQLGVHALQGGHEDDDRVTELYPDHDDHDGDQGGVRVAEPVVLQGAQPDGLQKDIQRTVLRAQYPADDDSRDHHGQDLRQVVGRPQEAGEPAAELLADEVEQHRGQHQSYEGGDYDHRDDHGDAVLKGRPELFVADERGPVRQPDPLRRQDAAIRGEAEIDVPDQRNQYYPGEQHEPGQQIPPESTATAGRKQTLAATLLQPRR